MGECIVAVEESKIDRDAGSPNVYIFKDVIGNHLVGRRPIASCRHLFSRGLAGSAVRSVGHCCTMLGEDSVSSEFEGFFSHYHLYVTQACLGALSRVQ
jgi:hypothetical protein